MYPSVAGLEPAHTVGNPLGSAQKTVLQQSPGVIPVSKYRIDKRNDFTSLTNVRR